MFERIVNVTPAFDKRHPDPSKNYGIGACRIWFILKGPKGAVQFQIGTDWYLPEQQKELKNRPSIYDIQPQGWDVGYHSYKPMYEGQDPMGECDVLGCTCYYDGSSLRADDWVPEFLAGGTEWLWPKLEAEYNSLFEGATDGPNSNKT